jgi:hypothetical protein
MGWHSRDPFLLQLLEKKAAGYGGFLSIKESNISGAVSNPD